MYNVRCVLPANCIFCDETKISLSFTKAIKIKRILRQNLYEFQYHAISPLYKYIYYWKSVSDIQFSSFYMARTHITFNKVQHSCKIFQISISNQHSCLSNYQSYAHLRFILLIISNNNSIYTTIWLRCTLL